MQMKRRFYMLKWFQEKHATPVLINSKLVWEGLGGETDLGNWCRKDGVWTGDLYSGYSLPMEDPKEETNVDLEGTWK
ncbi:hypothetical protein MTR_8g066150 [Medicago truncatula]|uniref:Uncharacterized protein n=1 Tax=Medicago truncatula TaxID=3880 RepID=G7LG93_MEDTR|nr:hypothetical protein MTR_8g066150 [Medicago truncatula]